MAMKDRWGYWLSVRDTERHEKNSNRVYKPRGESNTALAQRGDLATPTTENGAVPRIHRRTSLGQSSYRFSARCSTRSDDLSSAMSKASPHGIKSMVWACLTRCRVKLNTN